MVVSSEWRLRLARRHVRSGGIIAYPTEGVFGIGCDPLQEAAVLRLLSLKQRDWRQGLIIIGAELDQLWCFIGSRDPNLLHRLKSSWPGPVTWLVPASPATPKWLTGGRTTIALRVPGHELARNLCRCCGPLVSTSANLHARPPARTALGVRKNLGRMIDYLVPGEIGDRQGPSDIRDALTGAVLRR
ncbi:MAG: Sua5/YciO/YrdC/YwlC family protein [Gammaproteobacteria bacterium]|nr:Sua5/YciO/YrdC/YwlC family protein [Gammaproteobacteria bacterium]